MGTLGIHGVLLAAMIAERKVPLGLIGLVAAQWNIQLRSIRTIAAMPIVIESVTVSVLAFRSAQPQLRVGQCPPDPRPRSLRWSWRG